MVQSTVIYTTLALVTFMMAPAVMADSDNGPTCPNTRGLDVCLTEGADGCHDYCAFVCIENMCVLCIGDPEYVGSDSGCFVGGTGGPIGS